MNLNEIISILDQEVQKYTKQFGCPELIRILGQPCFPFGLYEYKNQEIY